MSVNLQTNQFVTFPAPPALPAPGTYNVLESDSGKTIIIPTLAADLNVFLPPRKPGLKYRFKAGGVAVNTVLAFAAIITPTDDGATLVNGTLRGIAYSLVGTPTITLFQQVTANTIRLTGTALPNDYIEVNCDGKVWHYTGLAQVATAIAVP